jgi:hypothetical protein
LLNTATAILLGNEDRLEFVPRSEFAAATECAQYCIQAFLDDSLFMDALAPQNREALLSQAFSLATAIKPRELAPLLHQAYLALDEEMVEMLHDLAHEESAATRDDSNDIIPHDSTMPPSGTEELFDQVFNDADALTDALTSTGEHYERVRLVSLSCLRSLALTASDLDELELFYSLLEGSPDTPEFAEALLGLAQCDPQAARPYIHQSALDSGAGSLGSTQALFNLLDREIAVRELTQILIQLGPVKGMDTFIVLDSFVQKFEDMMRRGAPAPGHDFFVEVSLYPEENSHGILLRAKTLSAYRELFAECSKAWEQFEEPS